MSLEKLLYNSDILITCKQGLIRLKNTTVWMIKRRLFRIIFQLLPFCHQGCRENFYSDWAGWFNNCSECKLTIK